MAGWFSKEARARRVGMKREKAQGATHKHAGDQPPPFWEWKRPWVLPSFLFYLWWALAPGPAGLLHMPLAMALACRLGGMHCCLMVGV